MRWARLDSDGKKTSKMYGRTCEKNKPFIFWEISTFFFIVFNFIFINHRYIFNKKENSLTSFPHEWWLCWCRLISRLMNYTRTYVFKCLRAIFLPIIAMTVLKINQPYFFAQKQNHEHLKKFCSLVYK